MLQPSPSTTHLELCSTQLEKLAKTQRNQKEAPGNPQIESFLPRSPRRQSSLGRESSSLDSGGKQSKRKVWSQPVAPLALNALFQKVLDDTRGPYLVQGGRCVALPPSSLRSWPHDQHPKLMNLKGGRGDPSISSGPGSPWVVVPPSL